MYVYIVKDDPEAGDGIWLEPLEKSKWKGQLVYKKAESFVLCGGTWLIYCWTAAARSSSFAA